MTKKIRRKHNKIDIFSIFIFLAVLGLIPLVLFFGVFKTQIFQNRAAQAVFPETFEGGNPSVLPSGWDLTESNSAWGTGWGENKGSARITSAKNLELIGHHVGGTYSRVQVGKKIDNFEINKEYSIDVPVFIPPEGSGDGVPVGAGNEGIVEVLIQGWRVVSGRDVLEQRSFRANLNLKNQWQTMTGNFKLTASDASRVFIVLSVWKDQKAIFQKVTINKINTVDLSNINGWTISKGPFQGHGSGLNVSQSSLGGKNTLFFGELGGKEKDGHLKVGFGSVSKQINVTKENKILTVNYNLSSRDILFGNISDHRYYDSFEFSINKSPDQIFNQDRDDAHCNDFSQVNPDKKVFMSDSNSLVFCVGGPDRYDQAVFKTGDKSATLDLSNFVNKTVTIYFTLWSREYVKSTYNDKATLNTFSYLQILFNNEQLFVSYDFSSGTQGTLPSNWVLGFSNPGWRSGGYTNDAGSADVQNQISKSGKALEVVSKNTETGVKGSAAQVCIPLTLQAGATYRFSGSIFVPTGGNASSMPEMLIQKVVSPFSHIITFDPNKTGAQKIDMNLRNVWQDVSGDFTLPVDAQILYQLCLRANNDGDYIFDDINLQKISDAATEVPALIDSPTLAPTLIPTLAPTLVPTSVPASSSTIFRPPVRRDEKIRVE